MYRRREAPSDAVAWAPLRISLTGGGTDLPDYASRFGGEVVAIALDLSVRITATAEGRAAHRWHDGTGAFTADPRLDALANQLIREHGVGQLSLSSSCRARAGAGLGSSGAFLVALAALLQPDASPQVLAEKAFDWEHRRAGRGIGPQDAFASAFGGLNDIRIDTRGRVEVAPLPVHPDSRRWLDEQLLLFDSGGARDASRIIDGARAARDTADRFAILHGIRELTGPLRQALAKGDTAQFGPLLTENWRLKSALGAGISTPRADRLLSMCMAAGAHGGKMVGAGGGGYVLVSVPREALATVRTAMRQADAAELAFSVSPQGAGRRPPSNRPVARVACSSGSREGGES